MKTALITGITGQDGSYLAELLLEKKYKVYGLSRETGKQHEWRIQHIEHDIDFLYGDLQDYNSVYNAMKIAQPDEVYNLAAMSFVKNSFENPVITGSITGVGVTTMLEALRQVNPEGKFYQASSSEMFGKVQETPQKETTRFYPRSPYGVAKLYGYWSTRNYRESYDMFTCNGILFNHESPRRGLEFVTRKISNAAARIKLGKQKNVSLGNLEAKRDWGYAKDYVEGMYLIMQHNKADDFVLSTEEQHSVQECCEAAFGHVDLDWKDYVKLDDKFKRPAEVHTLLGDSSKAHKELGWKPKVKFKELMEIMVEADLEFEKNRK